MKNSLALFISISILIVFNTQCSHPQQTVQTKLEPTPTLTSTPTPAPSPSPTSSQVVVTTKELAKLADSLDPKATMSGRLNAPQFFINEDTFVFYQGDVPKLGDDVITPQRYPILIPLARKLQLNDLRGFLSEKPEADIGYWNDSFRLADAILEEKSLSLIASGTLSGDELTKKLYEHDAGISQLLEKTAREFAEAHNLNYRRGTILAAVRHTVQVTFIKNPAEGHLYIVPSTLYAPDGSLDYMWREILDEKQRLGGNYYYKVSWPNGGVTPPTLFRVEGEGQVFPINQ